MLSPCFVFSPSPPGNVCHVRSTKKQVAVHKERKYSERRRGASYGMKPFILEWLTEHASAVRGGPRQGAPVPNWETLMSGLQNGYGHPPARQGFGLTATIPVGVIF